MLHTGDEETQGVVSKPQGRGKSLLAFGLPVSDRAGPNLVTSGC